MVQGVEKEFLLKSFYNDQVSILCRYNRTVYTLQIEKLGKTEISFKINQVIPGLYAGKKIDLTVEYKGIVVVFVVEVSSIANNLLVTTFPDLLYKNLDRAYPRVEFPGDMQVRFSFVQERYFLPFLGPQERSQPNEAETLSDPNLKTVNDITGHLSAWVRTAGAEYKLFLFKDAKPVTLEEQIIVKTGKTLFLPSTKEPLLETDPGTQKRVITKDLFLHYLESIGVLSSYFDTAIEQFIQSKTAKHICGDLWVPLCFKDYIAGYIHCWTTQEDKIPLPYTAVETLYGYANALVGALEEKGYFESFNLKNKFIPAQGIDISAGGVRFSYPKSYISDMLQLDSQIEAKLLTAKRTVTIKVKILRRYEEKNITYYGCHFLDMAPEDIRFLYEYIYGKPFSDTGGHFF
jgi:hypothetical protein